MYRIKRNGRIVGSNELQRAIGERIVDDTPDGLHMEAMRHMVAIENLEMRGARYSNHDIDVLWSAASFLDDWDHYDREERAAIAASKRGDDDTPPHASQALSCFV